MPVQVPSDFQLTRTVQIESRIKLSCYAEMQPVLAVVFKTNAKVMLLANVAGDTGEHLCFLRLLWLTKILHNEFDLSLGEAMGSRRRVKLSELTTQLAVVVDPEIKVVQSTFGCFDMGEIEQCKFRLAVTADFKFFLHKRILRF